MSINFQRRERSNRVYFSCSHWKYAVKWM